METETLNVDKKFKTWGFVGTLIWGLIIALVFIVIQFVVMVVYIGINYGAVAAPEYQKLMTDLQYNGDLLSICTLATFFVCGGMIVGIVKLKKGSNLKDYLGLKSANLKMLKYWFLILVAFIILSDSLSMLLGRPLVPEYMLSVYSSTEPPWLLWIALIVAAPIFEELFFRGFLISGLKSSIIGPVGAVLVSSFLWTAIHIQYDVYFLAMIFTIGLGLGIARLKSESVLLTIGLHSFNNLVATIETMVYVS